MPSTVAHQTGPLGTASALRRRLLWSRKVSGDADKGDRIVQEMLLPAELVIAEAKRWGIADDIALQVLPTGRINVICRGPSAEAFAEHLKQAQASGRFARR
jgi:hypothetical protein